jgi:hypothetical protein
VRKLQADFNGVFGDVLCLSHDTTCRDELGNLVELTSGMAAIAFEVDCDELGNREYLVAQGVVEAAPDWLSCNGSKWVLRIDSRGVRHEPSVVESD